MTYFKVIQNNNVIDVGTVFLKWNTRRNKYNICSTDEGQFVQSYNEEHIYRDVWMKSFPAEATGYIMAKVVIIQESEYNDLKDLLDENETIEVEKEEQPVFEVHEEKQETEEEKKLTLDEMREIIAKQQKQIELLTEKLT